MFYEEFVKKTHSYKDTPFTSALSYSSFRNFLKEEIKDKKKLILLLSKGKLIKKPYRLLVNDEDFFVGVDMNTNLHCIYYKNLIMIDVDLQKSPDTTLESLINICKTTNDSFIIYSSKNGYHIFIANRLFEKDEIIDYMLMFPCDLSYIVMSYVFGCSVRLNKKSEDDPMYSLLTMIGNDFKHKELVDIHIELTDLLKDILIYNNNPDKIYLL